MSLNGHSVAGTMKSVYVEVVGVAFDGCLVLNVHTAMGIRNFHLYLEVCLPVWASHAQNPRRRTFLVQIERVLAFLKLCSIGKKWLLFGYKGTQTNRIVQGQNRRERRFCIS